MIRCWSSATPAARKSTPSTLICHDRQAGRHAARGSHDTAFVPWACGIRARVATVSGFLTVGFSTANHQSRYVGRTHGAKPVPWLPLLPGSADDKNLSREAQPAAGRVLTKSFKHLTLH